MICREPEFNKGDLVTYCGEVYEVLHSSKYSDVIVLKKRGKRGWEVYAWSWKCRKLRG